MSPLEAAKRLAEANESGLLPSDADGKCWYCYWHLLHDDDGHAPGCPWPVLPKIVAALEAADMAIREWGIPTRCPFCGPRLQLRPENKHDAVCPWVALVAALKGTDDV